MLKAIVVFIISVYIIIISLEANSVKEKATNSEKIINQNIHFSTLTINQKEAEEFRDKLINIKSLLDGVSKESQYEFLSRFRFLNGKIVSVDVSPLVKEGFKMIGLSKY